MSIKKINGQWCVQISRKDMPRIRKNFKTKTQAVAFEKQHIESHQQQIDAQPKPNQDSRHLSDLIEEWYIVHGFMLFDGERRKRALIVLANAIDDPIAITLTPKIIADYRFQRLEKIAPKTANNELSYLNAVFNKLHRLQIIDYPCPSCCIAPIKLKEVQTIYLTLAEIDKLLNEIKARTKNESLIWVTELCFRTGARWGEAEKLTRRQLHNESVTLEKTKSGKIRNIKLDPHFYQRLLQFSGNKTGEQRLFHNCIGGFRRAIARTHIKLPKGQMTHICRHTFSSHYMIKGGSIFDLKNILGHSDIKMTMRYAHLSPKFSHDVITLNPLALQ